VQLNGRAPLVPLKGSWRHEPLKGTRGRALGSRSILLLITLSTSSSQELSASVQQQQELQQAKLKASACLYPSRDYSLKNHERCTHRVILL